jgi:hypothetical protein
MLFLLLMDEPDGAFPHFGAVSHVGIHDPILSKGGVSDYPGAVHPDYRPWKNP